MTTREQLEYQWQALFFTGFYAEAWQPNLSLFDPETEVDAVLKLLGAEPGSHILDWCGGMGRHSIALAKRGYQATCLDYSAHDLKIAREAAKNAGVHIDFVEADFRDTPASIQADYAINMFTAGLGYLTEEDDIVALKSLNGALRDGAKIVIDTMNLFYLAGNFRSRSWYEYGEGRLVLEDRTFDFFTNRNKSTLVQKEAGKPDKEVRLDHRVYSPSELVQIVEAADFKVEGVYGNLVGDKVTFDSPRIVLVAQK